MDDSNVNIIPSLSLEKLKKNKLESARKSAFSRHTDSHYRISKYMVTSHVTNPIFTKEDIEEKLKIFEVPDECTCFITQTKNKTKGGDHLWEINGYNKKTGYRGVDDDWNIIPVSQKENKTYKILSFEKDNVKIKKDIGYETLTDEEYKYLNESNNPQYVEYIKTYNKITSWKEYVYIKGAVIRFKNPNNYNKILEQFSKSYFSCMIFALESIDNLKQNDKKEEWFNNIYNKIINKSIINLIKIYKLNNSPYTFI